MSGTIEERRVFKHMTKIQARLLLASITLNMFSAQTLREAVALQFSELYTINEFRVEFQRFVEFGFFEPIMSRSTLYHRLSESGTKIVKELEAITADPQSPYYELTQPSMSPNVHQA